MLVQIMGIAQALSFETGESYSYVTILLPTGKEVRATVADDVIAELTSVFMGSGSPAAQAAIARVASGHVDPPPPSRARPPEPEVFDQMAKPRPEELQARTFSPVGFADGEDEAVSFGGDFSGEDQAQLHAIEQSLASAEDKLAHAIGDTTSASPAELRQVVARIQQQPQLPVPNIMEPPRQPLRRVEADSFGNPIITGAGLVDPRALMGGNTEGEEDAGQV